MIKNHIIGLKGNKISEDYMKITIPKIKEVTVNDEVLFWQGTTPETMPKDMLKFSDRKIKTIGDKKHNRIPGPFTPTEKAVWYSHLFLWKHLYENKIDSWIFEHDVDFLDNVLLPDVDDYDICYGKFPGCAFCYYVNHNKLNKVIDYVLNSEIYAQIDTYMYDLQVDEYIPELKITNFKLKITQHMHLGNTIEHL